MPAVAAEALKFVRFRTKEETGQMTGFDGEDLAPRAEQERIDRLAQWLEATLGQRLTAYASGATTAEVYDVAHGERVANDLERRLRNLYALTYYIAVTDGPGSAHEWLVEPNPDLDSRPPAQLLHDGQPPEAVWLAAAPTF
jgi:hypothetical protein